MSSQWRRQKGTNVLSIEKFGRQMLQNLGDRHILYFPLESQLKNDPDKINSLLQQFPLAVCWQSLLPPLRALPIDTAFSSPPSTLSTDRTCPPTPLPGRKRSFGMWCLFFNVPQAFFLACPPTPGRKQSSTGQCTRGGERVPPESCSGQITLSPSSWIKGLLARANFTGGGALVYVDPLLWVTCQCRFFDNPFWWCCICRINNTGGEKGKKNRSWRRFGDTRPSDHAVLEAGASGHPGSNFRRQQSP